MNNRRRKSLIGIIGLQQELLKITTNKLQYANQYFPFFAVVNDFDFSLSYYYTRKKKKKNDSTG